MVAVEHRLLLAAMKLECAMKLPPILTTHIAACGLLAILTTVVWGDEPSAPRPSIVVPLRFTGRPIRVIVDTDGYSSRRVRWAVGDLYEKLQIEQVLNEEERASIAQNPYEQLERVLDERLKAARPALHDEMHSGTTKWLSWNHEVDRRRPVDVVIFGSQGAEGHESASWVGIDITVRPYGNRLVAVLSPYYTEFKEAKGSRARQGPSFSFLGKPMRTGRMVKVPADDSVLDAKARLRFTNGEEQFSDDDPNADERAWAKSLALSLKAISLQCGIPLRFYVDDQVLEARVED